MLKETKLYFWDAAGKFRVVEEDLRKMCRCNANLTIYSLTPKGERRPTRLVVKVTPAGNGDEYLTARNLDAKEAAVLMCSLDYWRFSAEDLKIVCRDMMRDLSSGQVFGTGHHMEFKQCVDKIIIPTPRRKIERVISDEVTIQEFFAMDPRQGEPGAQIYLRDKAFFLSALSNPTKPDFFMLSLLTRAQKKAVTQIGMDNADLGGVTNLSSLFSGYENIRELDVSALNTGGVTSMAWMFCECRSLQRLDLSTVDFSRVKDLRNMLNGCVNLEEVIFSDTILGAGEIDRGTAPCRYTTEELNQIWKEIYISAGPQIADMDVEKLMNEKILVPFGKATEEERRKYLGLTNEQKVKLTIVPHCALKNR